MAKLIKNRAIAAHSESVQGTPIFPAATDYFQAWDVSLKPAVEQLDRDYDRGFLDTVPGAIGAVSYELSFKTEVKGSGTAGTRYQPIDALFESCGLSGSVQGSTVVYKPISSAPSTNYLGASKSATISVVTDGLINTLKGAVGSVKFNFEAHKIPEAEFTFKGLYIATADSASMPTVTPNETIGYPVQLGTLNISGSAAHIASKLEVDCGNTIAQIDDVQGTYGLYGFAITNRKPVGSFDPLGVSVATHAFLAKVVSGDTFAGNFQTGATAGNIVKFTFNNMQYRDFSMVSKNELLAFQIPLAFHGSGSGNNWVTITMM